MKIANLIIGGVIFSIVLTLMFVSTQEIMEANDDPDSSEFEALAGDYESITSDFGAKGQPMRNIINQTKQGEAQTEGTDVSLITGAISGGRLVLNFFTNFNTIINQTTSDINKGEAYIDNRIIGGIEIIIVIIIGLAVIFFLRGFRMET